MVGVCTLLLLQDGLGCVAAKTPTIRTLRQKRSEIVGEDGGDNECIPHDFHLFLQTLSNNMCFMMIDQKCSSRRINPTISHLASKGRVNV